MLNKVTSAARVLLVLVAIAAAFANVPFAAAALLVLGGVSAITNSWEDNGRILLVAIVLTLGAKSLDAIPVAGAYLAAVFTGLGTAAIGASIVGLSIGLARRVRSDWTAPASS